MKTYWDYTERERSEMSEDQVEALLNVELMTKGVAKVTKPVLPILEAVTLEKVKWYSVGPCCFERIEDAHAFLLLAPHVEAYDYSCGYDNKYAAAVSQSVSEKMYLREADVVAVRATLARNEAKKTEREKISSEYEKAEKAQNNVLDGVWDNWHEMRNLARTHKQLLDTLAEYEKMTGGDTAIAESFLLKLHTADEIQAAREWFGVEVEASTEAPRPVAAPVPRAEAEIEF